MITPLPETIHSGQLEDIVGLGEKRLRQLSTEGIIPVRSGRAEYPFTETLRSLFKYFKKRNESKNSDLETKLDMARLRKLNIANARAAREVISVAEAQKAHSEILMVFVQRCDDMPDKLGPALANRDAEYIKAKLTAEIRNLREALSAVPDYKYDDEEIDEDDEENGDDENA